MKIAVIGGGFTGLTAAYELTQKGHDVTVFERDTVLGGLAHGFKESSWEWYLEKAYHHLFTNDDSIINLIGELGLGDKLIIKRPITANYWKGATYQFDSPMHLLTFPGLSLLDKLRTGALVAFCKINPFWQPLENITAKELFIKVGGKNAWDVIWEPLMNGKFGQYDRDIAASWLWARIHKRTPSLAYIDGGFQTLLQTLSEVIKSQGGTIQINTTITSIRQKSDHTYEVSWEKTKKTFDKVLLTIPTPLAYKLLPVISTPKPLTIPHLHAQVLILETKQPIFKTTYWLNVTDRSFPFLAVVAHTNFMDKKHYGGNHLTYLGNYLPPDHRFIGMNKEQLLKEFTPYIKRLNPTFAAKTNIINSYLFTGPFAQPVHTLHYSRIAPPLTTTLPGVYLANMDSIYPWDRGTNYAVELGQKAAQAIMKG